MELNCPEVHVVDVPKNVYEWPNLLNKLNNFSKFYTTKEDYKKTTQYKARSQFVSDKKESSSISNFLKKIKVEPKIFKLNNSNIKRASQLTMKVNQFNFRTKRYSENDVNLINKDKKKKIYLLHLKDIYSEHGIIGVIIIEFLNDNNVFLDTFLMSCRVLGRDVEKWFIGEIINLCKKKKINNFYIELLITDKNQVAQEFLKDSFFSKIKTFKFNKKLIVNKVNKSILYKIDVGKFSFDNSKMYE